MNAPIIPAAAALAEVAVAALTELRPQGLWDEVPAVDRQLAPLGPSHMGLRPGENQPGGGESDKMCGRYTLAPENRNLAARFGVAVGMALEHRWNIAPGDQAPAVAVQKHRRLQNMTWGITPGWTRGRDIRPFVNARRESVFIKPAFQDMARKRRCIIPATGFYE